MTTPLDLLVELYLNNVWVDITCDVYAETDITIARGSSEWSDSVQPSRCNLVLKNTEGKYSAHNVASPYYRHLGRNVPIRVTVEGERRFLGEVAEWPQRIDPKKNVPLEASGVLRRLTRTITDEMSPIFRGFMRPVDPKRMPVAYWPMEVIDNDGSLLPADTRRGTSLVVNASESGLSTRSGFLGSKPLITLNDSRVYGDIPSYGATSDPVLVVAMVRLPDGGVAADNTPIMTVNCAGTAAYWRIRANMNGTINVQVADPTTDGGGGGVIATSANSTWNIQGRTTLLGFGLSEFGGTITWSLLAWPEYAITSEILTGNLASRTFLRVERVTFGSNMNAGATAIGHLAVWQSDTASSAGVYGLIHSLVNGHRGEPAATRAERIAQEEGIAFASYGNAALSLPMIQQGAKSGLDLLMEAAAADGGFLYEPPDVPTRVVADGEDQTVGPLVGTTATLVSSTAQAHTGSRSVRVTWTSTTGAVRASQGYFITGMRYTFTAWVYIPTGVPHVRLQVGSNQSAPSTVRDTWVQLSVSWTATSYSQLLEILPTSATVNGQQWYLDDVVVAADRAGLQLLQLNAVYNQAAALTVDYAAAEIALPFEPADDDRWLVNDVGVSIDGQGSPARYSLDSGPLSTKPSPEGVGTYSTGVTRNVLTGYLGFNWARWIVHQGTWNEPRFPALTVNLHRKRALIPAAAAVAPGSIVEGTSLPLWLIPRTIRQIVYGINESINTKKWMVTFNCAPGRPFDVFQVGTTTSRLSTESVLAAGTTAPAPGTSQSISVTSTGTRWATSGIFPVTITVAPRKGMVGEDMTVTAISGTGLTQTFTVTRGVNGVTAAWQAGDAVFLARRPTLSLAP